MTTINCPSVPDTLPHATQYCKSYMLQQGTECQGTECWNKRKKSIM